VWITLLSNFGQIVLLGGALGVFLGVYPEYGQKHRRVILGATVAVALLICGVATYEQQMAADELLGNTTGGNSFAYLALFDFHASSGAKQAVVVKTGKFPLFDLSLRVVDVDLLDAGNAAGWNIFSTTLPEVDSSGVILPVSNWPLRPTTHLRIFFSARNGAWTEDLILEKAPEGYWKADTRVVTGSGKVLFEKVEFPHPRWGQ